MTDDASTPAPQQKAVALAYDRNTDDAPRIAATGRGAFAEQLLRIAFDSGVPVREDAALVDILATLDEGSLIPLEAFVAVAEILSYIYRLNAASRPAEQGHP